MQRGFEYQHDGDVVGERIPYRAGSTEKSALLDDAFRSAAEGDLLFLERAKLELPFAIRATQPFHHLHMHAFTFVRLKEWRSPAVSAARRRDRRVVPLTSGSPKECEV